MRKHCWFVQTKVLLEISPFLNVGLQRLLDRCLILDNFFGLLSSDRWQLLGLTVHRRSRRPLNSYFVDDLLQQLGRLLLRCRSHNRACTLNYITVFVAQLLSDLLGLTLGDDLRLLGLTKSRLAVIGHPSRRLAYSWRKGRLRMLLSFNFLL